MRSNLIRILKSKFLGCTNLLEAVNDSTEQKIYRILNISLEIKCSKFVQRKYVLMRNKLCMQ